MEQKQLSCGPVYDQLPPLSAKYQWLLAQSPEDDEDGTRDQFFFNIQDPLSCYHCRIPVLLKNRVRGSSHGWLILSDDSARMWCLWDPITSNIIHLPPLILKEWDSTSMKECCLSLPPDDPKSILLLTRRDKSTFVFYLLENRKGNRLKWTEISYLRVLRRISIDGCLVHSLSCCNGKIYALNTDNTSFPFVTEIGIEVKDGKVVIIELMLFARCPDLPRYKGHQLMYFLRGSNTELFSITIDLTFEVETDTTFTFISLDKLDMTNLNWGELEGPQTWDITVKKHGLDEEEFNNMLKSCEIWEQVEEVKDGNFFVDLARDNSVAYSPAIATEFGGNIHIRSKTGKVIYSYNVNDETIMVSSMFPSPVLPTSHVSVWECRFAADNYAKAKQEVGDEDRGIVVRLVNNYDDDVELNESPLLNLPFHVLEMIMEFCIGLEYLSFRATCKCCHLAAPVLQWRSEVTLKRLQNYSLLSPWLMVADEKRGIVTFNDPLYGHKYFMKNLPDGEIGYSGYGWFLYHGECELAFCKLKFCNPFTNEVHHLPVTDERLYMLCFSAPPTSPDCMVVGFGTEGIYIHFVNGEQTWHLHSLDNDNDNDDDDEEEEDHDDPIVCFPTFYGRDLYALCDGKLNVFKNLGQEDSSWEQDVVEAPRSCRYPGEYFLTKCDQHVLLVFVDHFGESIELFKLNDFTKEWEKTNSLGRHTIYISNTCICVEAKTPEMEDKIFFARFYNKNGKVVFYSLKTGMYHTFSNAKNIEESFEYFVGTKHLLGHQAWIEPSWYSTS